MLYERGAVTRQAHVDLPDGTVEEEYARDGFSGRYAHFYRRRSPLDWTRIEGSLRPHAFRASAAAEPDVTADYLSSRVALLHNDDATISVAGLVEPMRFAFRNGDFDEVVFVHEGSGRIDSDFGPLEYERGDYLVIPRGTVYRFSPARPTQLLIVETAGEIGLPDRGLLGQHALFDPAVIKVPTPQPAVERRESEFELRVKRQGEITSIFYAFDPLSTIGWKGDLTMWQLNIRDIRPVSCERYHLPPTAHCTFATERVVICTFLPRPLETGDPGALKVPFYHSNIDYDEVLFYHDGNFFSRAGIESGMITFHPQGIPHGPQPRAIRESHDKTRTDEQAVMIDTRRPLRLTDAARELEVADYWKSWQTATRRAEEASR